jgi:UDP:flavonoid glycosyltransferase YjiC (YdhE family)
MRVLFTTSPLAGHFFPLVPLASACRSMGHEVLVATSEHFVTTALHAGLPAISSGPGIGLHELADPDAPHGIRDASHAHGRVFARMVSRNLAGTLAIVESWRPDVVVSERAELAGPIAAAVHGIPHAELHWGVPDLIEYRAAAESALHGRLRGLGLDGLPTPDAILNPWPPSLRLPHAGGHLGLRHVPYNGTARVSNWMLAPSPNPRICLTFGTVLPHLVAQGLTGLILDILENLARLDCELIVAMDDELAERLRPLPSAVRHAGRVPLSEALRTCQALIHHGGQGTSLTALAVGCPQVVLPKFGDQLGNADAVELSGAGLVLPLDEATPERVAHHCRGVLDDPRFGESALEVAREISAQPSPTDVAGVLERLVTAGLTRA